MLAISMARTKSVHIVQSDIHNHNKNRTAFRLCPKASPAIGSVETLSHVHSPRDQNFNPNPGNSWHD